MRLFRITRRRDRIGAFDGIGASMYPGRWNERTRRVVYVTSRIPLGILEVVVQSSSAPLTGYVMYPIDVPDASLEAADRSALSPAWRSAASGRAECRRVGETWRSRGASVGLIVPSAVVPEAYDFGDVNVVLNPQHADFAGVTIGDAIPIDLDARLRAIVSALPSSATGRRTSPAAKTRRRR